MKKMTILVALVVLALPLFYNACGEIKKSDTNTVLAGVENLSLDSTGGGNPMVGDLKIFLDDFNPRSIRKLIFCISSLKFHPVSTPKGTPQPKDIKYNLGDLELSEEGTELPDVILPEGTYEIIEMTLDRHCPSKKSVQMQRAIRFFYSTETIKLSFKGIFTAQQAKSEIKLGLDEVVKNLNSINANSEIKPAIESAMGNY